MSRASVRLGAAVLIPLLIAVCSHARVRAQDASQSSGTVYETSSLDSSYDVGATRAQPSASAGAYSAAPSREQSWGQTHVLGQHVFTIGSFTPTALVLSYVGVRAGLEYHQVPGFAQLPSLTTSTATAVNLKTLNVNETFDFGIKLHDHVALFGDGFGKVRIGANTATLLGTGADYTYGGDLGVLVKLFRIRGFQLSVSGQVGYYAGQSAGISALFQDLNTIARETVEQVQNDPTFDVNRAINQLNSAFRTATADLLTPFSGVRYGFALSGALALGRFVGLQASIGYAADDASYRPTRYDATVGGPVTSEHSVSTTRPSFGLGVDVDVSPVGVPLAFMVEYRATPITISDSQPTVGSVSSVENVIALGLFYSGRTDLQLGLVAYSLFGQPQILGADATPSGKPVDLALQLVFRYFW